MLASQHLLFKFKNRYPRIWCEIWPKLTIKTPFWGNVNYVFNILKKNETWSRPILELCWCDYRTQFSALSFEKKIFSSEIVKNDICLRGANKQMPFFRKIVPQQKAPMSSMSRTSSVGTRLILVLLC